jgi:hypothetical protein
MFINTEPDGTGTPRVLHGNDDGDLLEAWYASLSAEETADDSDKTFTVPTDYEWEVQAVLVEMTTTSTAGDRQLVVEFQDGSSDVVGQVRAGAVQAASLTRYYQFGQGLADLTAFRDTDYLMTPLPKVVLPAGFQVRILDKAAVDAAADDMIVQLMKVARKVA